MPSETERAYSWLQVNKDSTRNVVLIIRLVKEHVLAITALSRPFLEDAFFVDSMLSAEPLPVNGSHY
jgi:hypothetical protein